MQKNAMVTGGILLCVQGYIHYRVNRLLENSNSFAIYSNDDDAGPFFKSNISDIQRHLVFDGILWV